MPTPDRPQLYLITPPAFELDVFAPALAAVLDTTEVACLRLALATTNEDTIARAADTLRTLAHARDVALVIENHAGFVERLGLDGIHLTDGARNVRKLRKDLGPDAIIGAFCGTSRHDGMNAGEAGADYVSFGPAGVSALGPAALDSPDTTIDDLLGWWSEVIELPVVAEGALTAARITALAPMADFFAIGEEIWATENPAAALKSLLSAIP